MKRIAFLLFALAIACGLVAARAETSTPANEPAAKLIVDPPVPDLLAKGVVWALLPPGPHKIRIELVNAIHQGVPDQSKVVTFTIPEGASPSH